MKTKPYLVFIIVVLILTSFWLGTQTTKQNINIKKQAPTKSVISNNEKYIQLKEINKSTGYKIFKSDKGFTSQFPDYSGSITIRGSCEFFSYHTYYSIIPNNQPTLKDIFLKSQFGTVEDTVLNERTIAGEKSLEVIVNKNHPGERLYFNAYIPHGNNLLLVSYSGASLMPPDFKTVKNTDIWETILANISFQKPELGPCEDVTK